MINLIPPQAKKSLTLEYWLRVISVWCITFSVALLLGIVLLVPVYVLLNIQISVLSSSAASASQKIATLKDVSKELDVASKQARSLINGLRFNYVSEYTASFRSLESEEIQLSQISIDRSKDGVAPIRISGTATTRQALASFRDSLLTQSQVASVDLPIANLAKDRDIQFSLTVAIKKP